MMLPSKMITQPAFDCCVPFFPNDFFNKLPSIHLDAKEVLLPRTQPASDFFAKQQNKNLPTKKTDQALLNQQAPNKQLKQADDLTQGDKDDQGE
jgi:hypothetical protein